MTLYLDNARNKVAIISTILHVELCNPLLAIIAHRWQETKASGLLVIKQLPASERGIISYLTRTLIKTWANKAIFIQKNLQAIVFTGIGEFLERWQKHICIWNERRLIFRADHKRHWKKKKKIIRGNVFCIESIFAETRVALKRPRLKYTDYWVAIENAGNVTHFFSTCECVRACTNDDGKMLIQRLWPSSRWIIGQPASESVEQNARELF